MAETLKLGNGIWGTKDGSLLSYNNESGNYKPLPFGFTRASSATVVNKAGLIETVQSGTPRIDFLGNTNGALLLEPQRTNFALWSEDLSQSDWVKTGLTVNVNQITSPDGGLNADEVDITTANAHYLFDTISVSASTNYTFTFYVKKGTATDVSYSILNATNFTNIVNTTSYFNEISDTNWTRISVEFTTPSGATSIRVYPLRDGVSIGTIYIWGAQLEQSSYPTSYIPTQGSTVTRNLETCTGAGNDQVINSTEGVLYAEVVGLSNDTVRYSISDGSNSNNIYIELGSNSISAVGRLSAVNQFSMSSSQTITNYNKIAISYKQNDFALWINGVEVATDTSGNTYTSNTLNSFQFNRGDGGISFYGNTKDVRVYDTVLTDAELIALTT